MFPLIEIARTGIDAVALHPLRSLVACLCTVTMLTPYLVSDGLAKGIEAEAAASVRFGADLYVSGIRFGRSAPIPADAAARIGAVEGVMEVVPRIVGETVLGKNRESAILVGIPISRFAEWTSSIEGSAPRIEGANELVVGSALARKLGLEIGSVLLPFYRTRDGERVSRVVGTFKPTAPLWQANLIVTDFKTATLIFDQPGLATTLMVWCQSGYEEHVAKALEREFSVASADEDADPLRLRVTAREDLAALLPNGALRREGIFGMQIVVGFSVAILAVLVTSGIGSSERRREIGILKATGWQTDEVLLRAFVESIFLSLIGAAAAIAIAWIWLRIGNGFWVASLLINGVGVVPEIPLPFRLSPDAALLALIVSIAVILSGTLYSTWRTATVAPREALR